MVTERPPLCNGETTDYRRFIKEVITEGATGPRSMTLALISSVAHTFWTSRRVIGVFWFEQNQGSEYLATFRSPHLIFAISSGNPWPRSTTRLSETDYSTQLERDDSSSGKDYQLAGTHCHH